MDTARKYLFYTENYNFGGGNRYLYDFTKVAVGLGDVTIWANRVAFSESEYEALTKLGVQILFLDSLSISALNGWLRGTLPSFICMPIIGVLWAGRPLLNYFFSILNVRRMLKLLRRDFWDVTIAFNGGFPGGVTCFDFQYAANAYSGNTWMSVVSVPKAFPMWMRLRYSETLQKCKFIVNTDIASHWVNAHIKPRETELVYNTVSKIRNAVFQRNEEFRFRFVFVGRIEEAKGIVDLLEAFVEVRSIFPVAQLDLIGKNMMGPSIFERIRLLQLTEAVRVLGFVDGEMQEVLSGYDVFVFPSLWEGLPYSIIEAMAANLIIISTSVGGIPEILEHEVSALLVQPGNPQQLFHAIKRIANDSKLAARLKDGVEAAFERKLNGLKIREKIENILRAHVG